MSKLKLKLEKLEICVEKHKICEMKGFVCLANMLALYNQSNIECDVRYIADFKLNFVRIISSTSTCIIGLNPFSYKA